MSRSVPRFLSYSTQEVVDTFEFVYVPLFKDRSFLYQKYVEERLSPAEIAALIVSCRTTVAKHLREFGIPLRHEEAGYKTRSQLGYGEAWRGRHVVAHERELAAIEKMLKFRDRGWSYWKIADVLNDWGLPTKTGRGKWHARSVQQILGRWKNSTCEGKS